VLIEKKKVCKDKYWAKLVKIIDFWSISDISNLRNQLNCFSKSWVLDKIHENVSNNQAQTCELLPHIMEKQQDYCFS